MFKRPWETFFEDRVKKILSENNSVVDIGGGLRIARDKNNRYDPSREWMRGYIEKISYKVLDPVGDYNPDIVGDIHELPFSDSSQDALICLAVLEHVNDPIKACNEMFRVLRPGGQCLAYLPFLYYYHAERGYYKDFWRFSEDTINDLFKNFESKSIVFVRGPIETLIRLTPLGRYRFWENIGFILDKLFGKNSSKQVSGYFIFATK